jgi:hypothetical protein
MLKGLNRRWLPGILLWLVCIAGVAEEPGICINTDEAELLQAIDEYRVDNGLDKVPWSQSLMTVAKWHAVDAGLNAARMFSDTCNLHSWSDTRPELWSGGCYTSDHANASMMWNKPKEITDGVYTAYGFENGAWGYPSVIAALNGWKNSAGHNAVILNQGIWANYPWRAMGVGVDLAKRYYYLWFSTATDPAGNMPLCSKQPRSLFSNSFE